MITVKSRRLKVFQAQFGFHDSVVAASSQAAALKAWGTRQNLFSEGQARITTDEAATKAALAQPGVPLRRAIGSNDLFKLEPVSLPAVAASQKRPLAKPAPKVKPEPPFASSTDRTVLDSAERALRDLDDRRKREEAEFRYRQEALDAQVVKAQKIYADQRRSASDRVVDARQAYLEAGGED